LLEPFGDNSSAAVKAIAATKQIVAGKAQLVGNTFQAKLGFKKFLVGNTPVQAVKLLFQELTR
jgi:hypothetical protein